MNGLPLRDLLRGIGDAGREFEPPPSTLAPSLVADAADGGGCSSPACGLASLCDGAFTALYSRFSDVFSVLTLVRSNGRSAPNDFDVDDALSIAVMRIALDALVGGESIAKNLSGDLDILLTRMPGSPCAPLYTGDCRLVSKSSRLRGRGDDAGVYCLSASRSKRSPASGSSLRMRRVPTPTPSSRSGAVEP